MSPSTAQKVRDKAPTGTVSGEQCVTAAFLLGFYIFLSTWYRRRMMSSDGGSEGIPSALLLWLNPEQSQATWMLNYPHTKTWLFLWMMLCVMAIGLLYFSWPRLYGVLILAGVWIQSFLFFLGEQRLWTTSSHMLFLLSGVFLLGGASTLSFRVALTVVLWLSGAQALVLGLLDSPSWAVLSLFLFICGYLQWLPSTRRRCTQLLAGLSLLAGWFLFHEYLALLGILLWLSTLTEDTEEKPFRLRVLLLAGLLALTQVWISWAQWPSFEQGLKLVEASHIERVQADWTFGSGTEQKTLRVISTRRAGKTYPRLEFQDPITGKAIPAAMKAGEALLFFPRWMNACGLSLLSSPVFYRSTLNKIRETDPDVSASVEVEIKTRSGELRKATYRLE